MDNKDKVMISTSLLILDLIDNVLNICGGITDIIDEAADKCFHDTDELSETFAMGSIRRLVVTGMGANMRFYFSRYERPMRSYHNADVEDTLIDMLSITPIE